MMKIGIVDYDMGNLRSVENAVAHVGYGSERISSKKMLAASDCVILPGVGAFGDAMEALSNKDLILPLQEYIRLGKPFIGICLGLQLLFEESEESPGVRGLEVFQGYVRRFSEKICRKVPHMGWNTVAFRQDDPLRKMFHQQYFYFVHSYFVDPKESDVIAGQSDYGIRFCSVVRKDNVFAAQFHLEKSQKIGLDLLKTILDESRISMKEE